MYINFKTYLNESSETFKVGDKIKVKPYDLRYKNKKGKIVSILSSSSIGVEFYEPVYGGHSCYDKCKYGHGRFFDKDDIEKIHISKYVRQLQFEAFEPGQEPIPDVNLKKLKEFFIEVKTKREFEKISRWFYKHNFHWDMYEYSPIIYYRPWEANGPDLALRIHNIENGYGSINFNDLYDYKTYSKITKNKNLFSVDDFINIAKSDDRINTIRGKK